jgi:hypothetical protein
MGREGVRITHGTNEKGKDIIFYSTGGLGEKRLHACVVKNQRITGEVDASNGAKNVLFQAEQALDEPYVNHDGDRERVAFVYVFSPLDVSPSALESIQNRLAGRQVEFVCGHRLLDLFAIHWPSFLAFESGVLTSYLIALCKGLERDTALASLIFRKPFLTESALPFSEVYVEPTLSCTLAGFIVDLASLTQPAFESPLSLATLKQTRGGFASLRVSLLMRTIGAAVEARSWNP